VRRLALSLVALVLLLSACELRFELDLNDDQSGTFMFVVGVDPEFLAIARQGGANPFDERALERELPPGVDVEPYLAGELQGVRLRFHFDDLADLREKAAELARRSSLLLPGGAAGASIPSGFERLSLTRKPEGGWRLRMRAQSPGLEAVEGLPIDREQLRRLLAVELHVVLPGRSRSSNATRVVRRGDKTEYVWHPDPTAARPVTLVAETNPAPRSAAIPVAAGAAGAVGLALVASVVVRLRRRRSGALVQ
jgi:hypothetical protein